ncbi:putative RNA binding protein [Leptomonas pyrrhocoris]|uniref:Putative RNA binding protein n=1 Tax=Leptomonas pyrrhocoris TaxID=157538 RepID=A0A0M9FQY1_LEPPY|nr:putative RNA binding protein [Leptomonas pyrrhocoris]XP_015652694.1 putative RNA binding protein [Leptomonas pyrrhocoris]KPA74254.1 putative RNA binding protein [Leptomonas pyrrhocoris]KPA74255.1 putative RNA binding protein [Leptomonas pyrrhocoris]|eukprot:XP_015652693.1 putative RNA binding protein [Leptomonas pyrrhocoris]
MEEFYGLEVFVGKTAKPKIPQDRVLHITQVALPPNAAYPVTLAVKLDGKLFVLATLNPQQAIYHVNVDMLFGGKQDLTFTCEGQAGALHLVGYTQLADEEEDEEEEVDDDMHDGEAEE